ncbi:MAG: exo-alpha-sialidase [Thermoguttaceae bacterium]|nr:exo-alpha-sialidase [Thermoguttaceae bacterium]
MSARTVVFFLLGWLTLVSALRADHLEIYPTAEKMPTDLQGPFVLTDDGAILCLENRAIHRSEDGGKTWESRIVLPENMTDREERAILRTASGTILCAFLDENQRAAGQVWGSSDIDQWVLPTYVIRSTDSGKTWSPPRQIQRRWCGAIRSMIQHSSGRIFLVGQSLENWSNTTIVYYSDDDGHSWKAGPEMTLDDQGDHNGAMEGTIIERPDSSLYLLIRTTRGVFYESVSTDRGETWSPIAPSGIENNFCCGTMARLRDGKYILLWTRERSSTAYNHPEGEPYYLSRDELSAAFSDDARHWSEPLVIAAHPNDGTQPWYHYLVSYPYLCEVAPGELWITTMQGGLRMAVAERDLLDGAAAREKTLRSPNHKWVLILGDSSSALRRGVVTYEERLRKRFEEEGYAVDFVNAAVSGYTTRTAKEHFDRLTAGVNPNLVILQFGINDSAIDVWADPPATRPRVSEEEFAQNLRWMIERFQAKSIPVILMTTTQLRWGDDTLALYGKAPYDPDDPLSFTNVSLRRYNEVIRRVAEGTETPLVDIFARWDQIASEQGEEAISALLFGGKMHPGTAGHAVTAEELYPVLLKKLKPYRDRTPEPLKKID